MAKERHPQRETRRRRGHRRHAPLAQGPDGYMAVGKIVGPHGLGGEVKVEIHTDNQHRFDAGNQVLVGAELELAEIATSRPHRGMQLVRFEEIQNREEAESLRGEWLYIPDEAAMELDEQSHWVHQIVGLKVVSEEDGELGTISEVIFTGANDVYVVKTPEKVNRGRDLLIPALDSVIEQVDLDGGTVRVRLMPGMLDNEEEE